MSSYKTERCSGCGATLQDKDAALVGYTPKIDAKAGLCQRCFQLKHYAKTSSKVTIDEKALNSLVETLDFKKGVVCHVLDLLDLKGSLLPSVCSHGDVYFVVNKADLLPKGAGLPNVVLRLTSTIAAMTGIAEPRIVLASAKTRMGVRRLADLALAVKKNGKKLYFVGVTNAGKSSLVNALAKSLDLVQRMSVSAVSSTTLHVNAIQTKEVAIIDTPGAVKADNIYAYTPDRLKKQLDVTKGYRQVNYQLKNAQSMIVGEIAHVVVSGESVSGALTFYIPSQATIVRAALAKGAPRWEKIAAASAASFASSTFELAGAKTNIVVSGLLLASAKNFTGTITVTAPVGVLSYDMPAIV